MATGDKALWLKVLIGFIFTLMLLMVTAGANQLEKKVDKEIFKQHKEHQTEQFEYIKKSLDRIEGINK
jgi:cell division protein FtsX